MIDFHLKLDEMAEDKKKVVVNDATKAEKAETSEKNDDDNKNINENNNNDDDEKEEDVKQDEKSKVESKAEKSTSESKTTSQAKKSTDLDEDLLSKLPSRETFVAFMKRHPALFDRDLHKQFYSQKLLLHSPNSFREFVLPDLQQFPSLIGVQKATA